jgi:hypothetical protein
MSSSTSAKIFDFPGSRGARPVAQGKSVDIEQDPSHMMDDGMLAFNAYPFEIDELDPLLIVEGRNSDFIEGPGQARMTLIDNTGHEATARRFRLKDLHPMDVAIIAGFLVIVAMI